MPPVSELFTSVQGEGALTGVPSAFIRLSGCNLRCAWCDTPYASWSPEGDARSIDDLVAWARATNLRHAVLTGGEPMLFPELCELSARLAAPRESSGGGGGGGGGAAMHITIETAGTTIPTPTSADFPLTCHLMSISPKLANSTPRNDPRDPLHVWSARHDERRINIPVLTELLTRYPSPSRQLKFVVSSAADLAEIDALLARLPPVAPSEVLLMPEGVTSPAPALRDLVLAACLDRGFRYAHRLHIELFGHTRGT